MVTGVSEQIKDIFAAIKQRAISSQQIDELRKKMIDHKKIIAKR